MSLKLRAGLLLCLVVAAGLAVCGAYSSIHRRSSSAVPEEVYAQLRESEAEAEFFLRSDGSHVAVYSGGRVRSPLLVTAIEISTLRAADRAMLESGIPAADTAALLALLEDLGS